MSDSASDSLPGDDLESAVGHSSDDLEGEEEKLKNQVEALLEKFCARLAEHCESVRIIVTRKAVDGNTAFGTRGAGNYYAQRDSVREWLMRQDQQTMDDA